jgi:hypothetical protein
MFGYRTALIYDVAMTDKGTRKEQNAYILAMLETDTVQTTSQTAIHTKPTLVTTEFSQHPRGNLHPRRVVSIYVYAIQVASISKIAKVKHNSLCSHPMACNSCEGARFGGLFRCWRGTLAHCHHAYVSRKKCHPGTARRPASMMRSQNWRSG